MLLWWKNVIIPTFSFLLLYIFDVKFYLWKNWEISTLLCFLDCGVHVDSPPQFLQIRSCGLSYDLLVSKTVYSKVYGNVAQGNSENCKIIVERKKKDEKRGTWKGQGEAREWKEIPTRIHCGKLFWHALQWLYTCLSKISIRHHFLSLLALLVSVIIYAHSVTLSSYCFMSKDIIFNKETFPLMALTVMRSEDRHISKVHRFSPFHFGIPLSPEKQFLMQLWL